MNENAIDELVSSKRAAQMLDLSERTIFNLIREGRLVALKLGYRTKRIRTSSIANYIAECSNER